MKKLKNENSILQDEKKTLDEVIKLFKRKEQIMNEDIENAKSNETCAKSKLEEIEKLLLDKREREDSVSDKNSKDRETLVSENDFLKKELESYPKEKEKLLAEIKHLKKDLVLYRQSSNKQLDEVSVQLKVAKEVRFAQIRMNVKF